MGRHAKPVRRRRRWPTMVAAAVLAVPVGVAAPAIVAANADTVLPAQYSVTISPSAPLQAGQSSVQTVTFTNAAPLDSADVITAVRVTLPAGFTRLAAPASVAASNGQAWTVSVSGQTVTATASLLGGLLPTGSVAVPITETAPGAVGTYTWSTGATDILGGSVTRAGADPTVTVGAGPAAALAFVQQPTAVTTGQTITPTVTVRVVDAFGDTVPSYDQPVVLGYAVNAGGAPTPSGNAAAPVNGVASFPALAITQEGVGYRLRASSGTLATADSVLFDVVDSATPCAANLTCTSTVSTPTTSMTVTAASGPNATILENSLGTPAANEPVVLVCNTPFSGDQGYFLVDRPTTVTLTLDKSIVKQNPDNSASAYNVCYGSSEPFVTSDGSVSPAYSVPQVPGGTLYEGLLPDCRQVGNVAPCVSSRNKTRAGDEVVVFSALAGDPWPTLG